MKKTAIFLALAVLMAMMLSFSACTSTPATTSEAAPAEDADTSTAEVQTEEGKNFNVAIIQQMQHNALDASALGFQEELTKLLEEQGMTVTFDLQNASGDMSNYGPIATKFVNDDADLILAIGTSAAQAVANATTEIPILVTAVTDPESALLVDTNEVPGGNVSGTSDMNPIDLQVELLTQIAPDAKTVGILYCSAEDNSVLQGDMAKAAFEALGLEVIVSTVSDTSEIQAVTTNIVAEVDAIYIPTDNMFASAMPTVDMIATPAMIPVICGEENMAKEGGLATYSINYYNLGAMTGAQAFDILVNGADISTMPIAYSDAEELNLYVNEEKLAEFGLSMPEMAN